MTPTSVTVVLPATGPDADPPRALASIETYLESTGFTFEILIAQGGCYGQAIRKAVSEAKGSAIVIADDDLPYPVTAIGDAVAMIDSRATDVVFGTTTRSGGLASAAARALLVPIVADPMTRLKAFSSAAGKILLGETRLNDGGCDLEISFLANKYGFRIETLMIGAGSASDPAFDLWSGLAAAARVRLANRRNAYRPPRRCPVCFSPEVWTIAQIPANVIRACRRCKCRYLNEFLESEASPLARRALRAAVPHDQPADDAHSQPARERTSRRRLAAIRKLALPRARLLEIGVRDGTFGAMAAAEFEYVGLEPAPAASRHARARGLEVYCGTLSSFVNTGPSFDAVTLFHVFENIADPHDALVRLKDLLKPGGLLFLSTFDTEGLLYLLGERRRMSTNFRTHRILYSRSALIELLERSGFEIIAIGPEFEYRDHRFIRHWSSSHHPRMAPLIRAVLPLLPDPLMISTGGIRIAARRRAGASANGRALRAAEPTHAR